MLKLILLLNFFIYVSFLLNILKLKMLKSYEKEDRNYLPILLIILVIFIIYNNKLAVILFCILIKTQNILSYIANIMAVQTYYYYFSKIKFIKNNKLKTGLTYIEVLKKLIFTKNQLLILYYIVNILLIVFLPPSLFLVIFLINEIKNYYLYRLDHIYDSFYIGFYFDEEIKLTALGEKKIFFYRKNLLKKLEKKNDRLIYYRDYNHIED